MKNPPEKSASSIASDECQQVLNALLLRWPDGPSDNWSSAHLDHLCHCRNCLRKWIALEAAADLAGFSAISCDEFDADVDGSVAEINRR